MTSLFGGAAASTPSKSPFSLGPAPTQQAGGSLFGAPQQQQQQQQQPQGTSLFGGGGTASQAPSTSFFGSTASAPKPTLSLFGGSTANANTQQGTSLFGGSTATANAQQQQQPGQSLFGGSTANASNNTTQLPALSNLYSRSGGLFGASAAQPAQAPSLFGQSNAAGQSTQPQGPLNQTDSLADKIQTSRIWTEHDIVPPQKDVLGQIRTVWQKWDPSNSSSRFQTYLYNNVGVDAAPFYRPGAGEDEQKWEDALAKAPSEGCIPVPIRGFQDLGNRIVKQTEYFNILQGRLHEINNGLSELLRRHDLEISARAAECRRRHVRLSQKCLNLATKTQILRNRGYALDSAEEELSQKLRKLEKQILDPALSGREEEIWARMVSLRERGRILQAEFEKNGGGSKDGEGGIDDETLKRAKKILEDYDSQLTHLSKELMNITKDYEEWNKGRTS